MTYATTGLHLSFSLVHWAAVLEMCPLVCTAMTLEGMSHYRAAFLQKVIPAIGGQGPKINLASNVSIVLLAIKTMLETTPDLDIVSGIFQPVLSELHKFNVNEEIPQLGKSYKPHQGDVPQGYQIDNLLQSLSQIKSFAYSPYAGKDDGTVFQDLVFRKDLPSLVDDLNRSRPESIRLRLVNALIQYLTGTQAAQGTAWSFLPMWAQHFSLKIVPRVHEIGFIPDWTVFQFEQQDQILELKHLISVKDSESSMQNPAGAMVAISASAQVSEMRTTRLFDLNEAVYESQRGEYIPGPEKGGPVGICTLPPALSGHAKDANGALSGKWLSEWAEHKFWQQQYGSSSAMLLSPIRFDVCPGSTVKFSAGMNTFTQIESVGYVQQIKWDYNVEQGATCSIQVGFVRPASSLKKYGAAKHFFYDAEKPFLNASWIADPDFKTFE